MASREKSHNVDTKERGSNFSLPGTAPSAGNAFPPGWAGLWSAAVGQNSVLGTVSVAEGCASPVAAPAQLPPLWCCVSRPSARGHNPPKSREAPS